MMQSSKAKAYLLATRPWSLTASATPVIVTLAWLHARGYDISWPLGLCALVDILLVHAAGNVWSDYFDFRRHVDAADTYGVKILTSGQFTPQQIMRLSALLLAAAVVVGIALVLLTGPVLLCIGLAGIALSLLYPPLKYHALGDVVIALCYWLLPTIGTSFVATASIHWEALLPVAATGLITVAILHANNTRDIETDARAGITTFAMRTGRGIAVGIYLFEIFFPYLWLLLLILTGALSPFTLLTLLSLPLAFVNAHQARSVRTGGVPAIANLDEHTARQQLVFSLLLALALFL